MAPREIMKIKNIEVSYQTFDENDYLSLTDIAKFKNANDPRFAIQNWMKTRYTVDFLGIWERMYNKNFNRVEFDTFKSELIKQGLPQNERLIILNVSAISQLKSLIGNPNIKLLEKDNT